MIKFGVSVPNPNTLKAAFDKILYQVQVSLKPLLSKQAGMLASDLAKATPPLVKGRLGTGASGFAAFKTGERSLKNDVQKVFKPLSGVPFASLIKGRSWNAAKLYDFEFRNESLAKAYKSGKWDYLYSVFSRSSGSSGFQPLSNVVVVKKPTAMLHNSSRGNNGKVGRIANPIRVSGDGKTAIKSYADSLRKTIGTMVSGWVSIANKLGSPMQSSWTGRSPKGTVKFDKQQNSQGVTISNPLGNFNSFASRNSGAYQAYLNKRMKALQAETNALLKRVASKATTDKGKKTV